MRPIILIGLLGLFLSLMLAIAESDLFDCSFSAGTAYEEETMYLKPNTQKWSHLSIWVGYEKGFNEWSIGRAADTAVSWDVPLVYYAYVIAFAARFDEKLQDCDMVKEEDINQSLCGGGSEYIRNHRNEILDIYEMIAQKTAQHNVQKIYWKIEPDYYQYSINGGKKQINGGLSNEYLAELYHDIRLRILKHLPSAKIGIDISSWLFQYAPIYYSAFNNDDVDFMFTSGGRASPNTTTVGTDESWSLSWWECGYGYFGKKPVIADCGYGVGGSTLANCDAWLSSLDTVQKLVNLNVVSVTASIDDVTKRNEFALKALDYCNLPYTPSEPPYTSAFIAACPVEPETRQTTKHLFGTCLFHYGYTWDWNFQQWSDGKADNPFTITHNIINVDEPDNWMVKQGVAFAHKNKYDTTLVISGTTGEQYLSQYYNIERCTKDNLYTPQTYCHNDGAKGLLTYRSQIFGFTKDWAGQYKRLYTPEQRSVWVVEPRLAYLSEQSLGLNNGGLTPQDVGNIWSDAYFAYKYHFPNGIVALCINPSWNIEQLRLFISYIPNEQISIIYIAYETISPDGEYILVSDNNNENNEDNKKGLKWSELKDELNKPILIETNNPSWYNKDIYTTQYNQHNIIGIISNTGFNDLVTKGRNNKNDRCAEDIELSSTWVNRLLDDDTTPLSCMRNYNCIDHLDDVYDDRPQCAMGGIEFTAELPDIESNISIKAHISLYIVCLVVNVAIAAF